MPTMREILNTAIRKKFATDAGTAMHRRLQCVTTDDEIIKSHPELAPFFGPNAKTEVPIAGVINSKFISRRIDRLIHTGDTIIFLDYKSDTDKFARHENYVAQIHEYSALLHAAYPDAIIRGFILWTNDFTLEEIK